MFWWQEGDIIRDSAVAEPNEYYVVSLDHSLKRYYYEFFYLYTAGEKGKVEVTNARNFDNPYYERRCRACGKYMDDHIGAKCLFNAGDWL
jgi:hypothetical protein